MKFQRDSSTPFFIGLNRAMISLGPLSKQKYCPFSCAFCYVNAGFESYSELSIEEIISYLHSNREKFDIIYISGDTDSFAPPRKNEGLKLLDAISREIDIDVLFTTRTTFSTNDLNKLEKIRERINGNGNYLFGCISISRLKSVPHIEPPPIPSPQARIKTLCDLKQIGIITFLAVRPFLPIISSSEYIEIIANGRLFSDVVLGEYLYADNNGIIEKRVFQGPTPENINFEKERKMDFSLTEKSWKVWCAANIKNDVQRYCESINMPFFMHSQLAVDFIRQNFDVNKIEQSTIRQNEGEANTNQKNY